MLKDMIFKLLKHETQQSLANIRQVVTEPKNATCRLWIPYAIDLTH